MTLDLPPSIVLISADVSLYSVNLVSDLLKCKTEYLHLYHCPDNIFAFLPISNAGVCEVELTQKDASKALALCPYKQLAPQSVFHRSFFNYHYFFFTQTYFVSIMCADDRTYK